MSEAIAKLKYAYEHSQMISSPEMREELGRQFDNLIAEVQALAWDEAINACAEQGTIQEPDNPYLGNR